MTAAATREFDTMLMVSALKCRYERPELLARYNVIVRHNRPALVVANQRLRAHFQNAVGKRDAEGAYDRYVTRVANRYGAAAGAFDCAAVLALADAALAEPAAHDSLSRLALRAAIVPDVAGVACAAPKTLIAATLPRATAVVTATTIPRALASQVNTVFGPVKVSRSSVIVAPPITLAVAEKPPSMTLGYNFELR